MKTIFLSKTFWVQVIALAMLLFPPVKNWLEQNPVEYLTALAAVNVLLRFLTSGAVSILPGATTGPEDSDSDNTGTSGRLLGWLLPAGLAGLFGFALPACIPVPAPAGTMAISGEVITDGATLHYSSKGGIGVVIDTRSGK